MTCCSFLAFSVFLLVSGNVDARLADRRMAKARGLEGFVDHPVNHVSGVLDRAGVLAVSNSTTYFYNNQVLDHFDSSVVTAPEPKWSQRYYVDSTFWGGEGFPIFLYIGGEGPQSAPSSRLLMYTLAQEHNALMIALEHRYYGESQPVENMSNENLVFLTSTQALADLERFLSYILAFEPSVADTQSTPALELPAATANSKVVTFGGSYPGNLATWLKLKYPASIEGTVGSSAPVFAEFDFEQYAQVTGFAMGYDLIGGSPECYATIDEATADLEALLLSTTPYGASDEIPEQLKPCSTMTEDVDLATYEAELFGNFQGTVQYNLQGYTPYVADLCNVITDATDAGATALEAFAAASALFYPDSDSCVSSNFTQDYVSLIANTSFSGSDCDLSCTSDRQWVYQSCNEFGYFQTTTGADQPFKGFTYVTDETAGTQVCVQGFGLEEAGLTYTGPKSNALGLLANTEYGARHVEGINVTMPNGNCDPWHALSTANSTDPFYESGSTQEISPGVAIVEIDGTAHCRDMYAPGAFEAVGVPDTEPVKWAHSVIMANVAAYISN